MSGLAYILLGQSRFFSGVNLQRRLRVSFDLQFLANAMRTPFPIRNRNRIDGSSLSRCQITGYTWHQLRRLPTMGCGYISGERFTEPLTFESEVYLSSSGDQKKRTFQIRQEGLPDIVVWNPWGKKSKAIADLGDEEHKQMLCVDGAAIEEWTGRLELCHPFQWRYEGVLVIRFLHNSSSSRENRMYIRACPFPHCDFAVDYLYY